MVFQEIIPFVRFARYHHIRKDSVCNTWIPCDARLFYTLSGEGTILADGQTFHMAKGSAILIHPGVEYSYQYEGCDTKYIVLNFDYTRQMSHIHVPVPPIEKGSDTSVKLIDNVYFSDIPALNTVLHVPQIEQIESILIKAVREHSERLMGFSLSTSALLTQALLAIYRQYSSVFLSHDSRLSEILNYIHRNYGRRLTNQGIAQEFNYHPNHLSRIIKAGTGMPLHQYLLQYRILKSIQYLESGSYSISQIAQMCGFYDVYYFSRYFKEMMQVTPSAYMKGKRRYD